VERSPLPPVRRFLQLPPELAALTLRFHDPGREQRFREAYFRDNLAYVRLAHLLGAAVWAIFGILAGVVLRDESRTTDLVLRYGVVIPVVAVSFALTFAPWYGRVWQQILGAVLVVNGIAWSLHGVLVPEARRDWGYAGIMLILAFVYTLSRIRFVGASLVGAAIVVVHNVVIVAVLHQDGADVRFADFFLLSFAAMGMAAAYGLERFTRLVFLREEELQGARRRADALLRNTLPHAIVERLEGREEAPEGVFIADDCPAVSVLFADLVGFTDHSGRIPASDLIAILDDVFRRFDGLAAEFGVEKIKTVGDAYMAVAGAPLARDDHAEAAAEMALAMVRAVRGSSWPTGEPLDVRVGVASGPAVAGVIGRQKFAYDLWGDTVNLASRLEAGGEPGRILIAESTAALLDGRFELSAPVIVELKGKGPTAARFLEGRR
jgi:class 3 adenylate cyclase